MVQSGAMATSSGANAATVSEAASNNALAASRVDELALELDRCLQDAQAQFVQERSNVFLEYEAERVRLHTEYTQRLLEADQQLQALHEERRQRREARAAALCTAAAALPAPRQSEVLTLNVGGQLHTLKRETLCVCAGSFMAELFSGRWDHALQRDPQGHIFLDIDPAVFAPLATWLRDSRIETPERPAPLPSVLIEDVPHFQAVIDCFGIRPYLEMPGLGPDGWALVCGNSAPPATSTVTAAPSPPAAAEAPAAGGSVADRRSTPGILEAAGSLLSSFRSSGSSSRVPPDGTVDADPATMAAAGSGMADVETAPDILRPALVGADSAASAAVTTTASTTATPRASGSAAPAVCWSQRHAHPAARRGDGASANIVSIGDTRGQGGAAAVRATRGYQTGLHYWEVEVLTLSDCSYIGLVSSEWADLHQPVGLAPDSWAITSGGMLLACGTELRQLPQGFSEGSVIGALLELGEPGQHRSATLFVDGRRYTEAFTDLPDTVYPAASNLRAPAQYSLACDVEPPAWDEEASAAVATASALSSSGLQ
mmetsp:Transcript_111418/g.215754  ORF Transcript_111418/g.215754 Transcript_111418/m.215754 type:complete len:544 (+) Transcript_111418:41-1672(+)